MIERRGEQKGGRRKKQHENSERMKTKRKNSWQLMISRPTRAYVPRSVSLSRGWNRIRKGYRCTNDKCAYKTFITVEKKYQSF